MASWGQKAAGAVKRRFVRLFVVLAVLAAAEAEPGPAGLG